MQKPGMQKIVTPGGETLVVLPLSDYERLLDAADISSASKVRGDIAGGRDEMVPAELVTRLIESENPVRVWRRHRGLTGRALAASAGIGAAYLSEIETGRKEGSLAVMKRLAEALSVDLDDLV